MMKNNRKSIVVWIALCLYTIVLSSCAVIRGLALDGVSGPDMYAYRKLDKDTISKGNDIFRFPLADEHSTLKGSTQIKYGKHGEGPLDSLLNKWFGDDCQMLIIHNDSIVYDKCFGNYFAGENATVFSVSKSITGLLCGIAVDEGYIKNVDDFVTDYLPELRESDPMFQQLKIVHLLNMQTGLDFQEEYSLSLKNIRKIVKIAQLQYGRDYTKVVRNARFKSRPGGKYEYNSLATAILCLILERATGKSYAQYMSEKVWKPLGMQHNAWITLDSRKHRHAHGFGGIATNVYDLAKIGRLYLNKGVWNGRQIVSKEWIENTLIPTKENNSYHYNWYYQYYKDGTSYDSYYALGIGHKLIYINLQKNVIITWIGNHYNASFWEMAFFDYLCKKLF